MNVYFLPDLLTFVPESMRLDGSYSREFWEQPNVLLTEEQWEPYWRQNPPPGKQLGQVSGMPAWLDLPGPDLETQASTARSERDRQLEQIYDKGINIALRAHRLATDPVVIAAIAAKIHELDLYAEGLLAIPEQSGFPASIVWPAIPTKEL